MSGQHSLPGHHFSPGLFPQPLQLYFACRTIFFLLIVLTPTCALLTPKSVSLPQISPVFSRLQTPVSQHLLNINVWMSQENLKLNNPKPSSSTSSLLPNLLTPSAGPISVNDTCIHLVSQASNLRLISHIHVITRSCSLLESIFSLFRSGHLSLGRLGECIPSAVLSLA